MNHLITYGTENFNNSKLRLLEEAINTDWFTTVTLYGPEHLSDEFKETFKTLLLEQRGAGYWIWKSYIIKKRLDEIAYGDILIYLDAGCHINKNGIQRFHEYIDLLNKNDEGMLSFQMSHIMEKKFTTQEIFSYFDLNTNSIIANSGQFVGGILLFKKNNNSILTINKFYEILYNNPLLFTDHYNANQDSYFEDNRHDQSILSVLRKIHGSIIIEDETCFIKHGVNDCMHYPFWATRLK